MGELFLCLCGSISSATDDLPPQCATGLGKSRHEIFKSIP